MSKVSPGQIYQGKPEWYLPVRAVFDPSSKGQDGLSLNEHLEKGPNFINSLCDVLAARRWKEVAFTDDFAQDVQSSFGASRRPSLSQVSVEE